MSTGTATRLRAVTREIDAPIDVLDGLGHDGVAWLHDGAEFATSGAVARVLIDDSVELLAGIEHEADPGLPGAGPRAIGALPFEIGADTTLLVPARITGRTADGRGWVTQIAARDGTAPPSVERATHFEVAARSTYEAWCTSVLAALDAIERGELTKVVLARAVSVEADQPFDVRGVLRHLRAQQPGCFVYAADGIVGASPELLIARYGSHVISRPLAGTAVLGAADDLGHSEKDAWEHRLVVAAILDVLRSRCDEVDAPAEPEVDEFADVAHLATPIHGTLTAPAPDTLELVRALHPTPAVAGTPTRVALDTIARLEPVGRGRYAGPVGWVDANGDGEWAVALRGAAIDGTRAVLHAGAGIVAGSDADAEWEETGAKLDPMLRALVRP
jgi:menaquinone-specific isochorismate synthase